MMGVCWKCERLEKQLAAQRDIVAADDELFGVYDDAPKINESVTDGAAIQWRVRRSKAKAACEQARESAEQIDKETEDAH